MCLQKDWEATGRRRHKVLAHSVQKTRKIYLGKSHQLCGNADHCLYYMVIIHLEYRRTGTTKGQILNGGCKEILEEEYLDLTYTA